MDFNLNFVIDPADLSNIKAAQQKITLAKPVNAGDPSMIWLSIDPFASTEVEWTEEYGIYASTVEISHGVTISKLSEVDIPAQDGAFYTLTPATTFDGPFTSPQQVPTGSFGAQNDVPNSAYPVLTFGLTQTALVNQTSFERKPLSAESVLATQFVEMTPFTIVYAWLQSEFKSETMITQITGKVAKIRLGGSINSMTLKYNPALGMFAPSSGSDANVELLTLAA